MESLISQGVKVIIIAPQDATAAAAAAEEARQAGAKVISYDRLIRDTPAVDYYVTFDSSGERRGAEPDRPGQGQRTICTGMPGDPADNNAFLFFEVPGGEIAAQDCRRHIRRQELQRSRGLQGQTQADP